MSDGRKLRIYLDLDGVLCDFVSAAYQAHGRQYGGETLEWDFFKGWGLNARQFWYAIDNLGEAFWANLEPYPWCYEVRDLVASYDPDYRIATSPSEHPNSAAGKVRWIRNHLPGVTGKRRHLTSSKHELAKSGRVLIDDSPANCAAWFESGGRAILFPAPHNGLCDVTTGVVDYLRKQLRDCFAAEVRQRQARQREEKR